MLEIAQVVEGMPLDATPIFRNLSGVDRVRAARIPGQEAAVLFPDPVQARGQPVREIGARREIRREARDAAVRVALIVDRRHRRHVALDPEPAIRTRTVFGAGQWRAELRVAEPAKDVVVVVGQIRPGDGNPDARVQRELRRRDPVKVETPAGAIETIVGQDAIFGLAIQRGVVAVVLTTTAAAPIQTNGLARPERALAQQRIVADECASGLPETEYPVGIRNLQRRAPPIVRARREVLIDRVVIHAETLAELPAAGPATLGDHLDDTR